MSSWNSDSVEFAVYEYPTFKKGDIYIDENKRDHIFDGTKLIPLKISSDSTRDRLIPEQFDIISDLPRDYFEKLETMIKYDYNLYYQFNFAPYQQEIISNAKYDKPYGEMYYYDSSRYRYITSTFHHFPYRDIVVNILDDTCGIIPDLINIISDYIKIECLLIVLCGENTSDLQECIDNGSFIMDYIFFEKKVPGDKFLMYINMHDNNIVFFDREDLVYV